MLGSALTSLTQPTPPADRSALLPILEWLVQQSLNAIEEGIGIGGVAALLTEEDPDFTALIRSLLVQHRNALANVVRDASLAGEVREDLDVETMMDCIVGAYHAMASVDRPTRQRALAISWIWRDGGATRDTSVCRVSQVLPFWPLRFETARLHETTTNPLVSDAVDAA
jgi:hypothetical protein